MKNPQKIPEEAEKCWHHGASLPQSANAKTTMPEVSRNDHVVNDVAHGVERKPTDSRWLQCERLISPLGLEETHPRLSWTFEAAGPGPVARGMVQSAYRILVASSPEKLAADRGDIWDSGKVHSSRSIQVDYAGPPLSSRQSCNWKVRAWDGSGEASSWSAPARWTMGLLRPEDWPGRWITANTTNGPLPLFRTRFNVRKSVRRAELAICGLGFFEARLNGKPVDDSVLEPGWTDYRKTCLYSVHDITGGLRTGENVLGVMLGNGMYNVAGGRYTKFTGSFGAPKLIARLDIEYDDGSRDQVASDRTWATAPGPIIFSCIYGGEDYDAGKECSGWDRPGYDASNWLAARECSGPGGRLSARSGPPIKVKETIEPSRVSQPKPGVWIYDLGQNFSGWPRLSVTGIAGATVKLVTGELLDWSGLSPNAVPAGRYWFSYTLKGSGVEVWEPRFCTRVFVTFRSKAPGPRGKKPWPRKYRASRILEGRFLTRGFGGRSVRVFESGGQPGA